MRAGKRTRLSRQALIGALAMCAAGCAGIERFAPPGIVKYEDLAKGQPMNDQIKARVAEARSEKPATFPNLSKAPRAAPATLPEDEQAEREAALKGMQESLSTAVAADRGAIGADGGAEALVAARDALKALVEADDAKARAERGLPRRKPPQP